MLEAALIFCLIVFIFIFIAFFFICGIRFWSCLAISSIFAFFVLIAQYSPVLLVAEPPGWLPILYGILIIIFVVIIVLYVVERAMCDQRTYCVRCKTEEKDRGNKAAKREMSKKVECEAVIVQ